MTTEIALRSKTVDDLTLATMLAESGYFKGMGVTTAAQALAKIIAGREMGFGAASALLGVHIIEGKPSISAGLMASAVKRSGKYNYRLHWLVGTRGNEFSGCRLTFYEGGQEVGRSEFTLADAAQAGLANKDVWKKYPRNMCFARALSNGVRWYCPDVFQGAVYVPEELGADVNEDGEVINGTAVEVSAEYVAEFAAPAHTAATTPPDEKVALWDRWREIVAVLDRFGIEHGAPPEDASAAELRGGIKKYAPLADKAQADYAAGQAAGATEQVAQAV